MFKGSGVLSFITCPLQATCTRQYCLFRHDEDFEMQRAELFPPTNQHPVTQPVSPTEVSSVVISQEEALSDLQVGGYYGYLGSVNNGNINHESVTSNVYAQEPNVPSSYQQQPSSMYNGQTQVRSAEFNPYQMTGQNYGYSTPTAQASLYAPEDPMSYSASNNLASSSRNDLQQQNAFDYYQQSYPSTSYQQVNANVSQTTASATNSGIEIGKPVREREQFSPLSSAVPPARIVSRAKPHAARKKSAIDGRTPAYVPTPINRTNNDVGSKKAGSISLEKDDVSNTEVIDDILSTATHVSDPSASSINRKRKQPLLKSASVAVSAKNRRENVNGELSKKLSNRSIVAENNMKKPQTATSKQTKLVFETKAAPPSVLRARKESKSSRNSSDRDSSGECVILVSGDTAKERSMNQKRLSSTKVKGNTEVVNANIKAIADIEKEIAEKELALLVKKPALSKESQLQMVKQKGILPGQQKSKGPLQPSAGALHNPHFDINTLFDDEDFVADNDMEMKRRKSDKMVRNVPKENGVSHKISEPPLIELTKAMVSSSARSTSCNIGAKKKMPAAQKEITSRFENSASASPSNQWTAARDRIQMFNKRESRTARVTPYAWSLEQRLVPIDTQNWKLNVEMRKNHWKKLWEEYSKIADYDLNEAVDNANREEKMILDNTSTRNEYIAALPSSIKKIRDLAAVANLHRNSEG